MSKKYYGGNSIFYQSYVTLSISSRINTIKRILKKVRTYAQSNN